MTQLGGTTQLQPPIPSGSSALVVCDVFKEELDAMPTLPACARIAWIPMGLHDRPAELRARVQSEVDGCDADSAIATVLLLFGMCGGGLDGIRAKRCRLVVPRAHDCIALLLGANARHRQITAECPGTYFYTPGWIRERRVPGPDRETHLRERYADTYDDDVLEDLIEADRETFAHYERALFVKTPAAGSAESYCRRCAEHLGWRFQCVEGNMQWLHDCLHGPWDAARFAIAEPGQTLQRDTSDGVFRAVSTT